MRVYAEVDGTPVFPGATPSAGYTGRTFTLTPESENGGVTALFEFSITNLGFATPVYDSSGALVDVQRGGVALEDGNGTQEHTLRLFVGIDSFFGEQQPIANDMFVWDTSEVPSGITFNPPELAAATVQADLPNLSG
jgi:hypothetical protein